MAHYLSLYFHRKPQIKDKETKVWTKEVHAAIIEHNSNKKLLHIFHLQISLFLIFGLEKEANWQGDCPLKGTIPNPAATCR
jgi:hypothetical protein